MISFANFSQNVTELERDEYYYPIKAIENSFSAHGLNPEEAFALLGEGSREHYAQMLIDEEITAKDISLLALTEKKKAADKPVDLLEKKEFRYIVMIMGFVTVLIILVLITHSLILYIILKRKRKKDENKNVCKQS